MNYHTISKFFEKILKIDGSLVKPQKGKEKKKKRGVGDYLGAGKKNSHHFTDKKDKLSGTTLHVSGCVFLCRLFLQMTVVLLPVTYPGTCPQQTVPPAHNRRLPLPATDMVGSDWWLDSVPSFITLCALPRVSVLFVISDVLSINGSPGGRGVPRAG
jgi:hypothetical protein